ncbi:MAG TPA: hypothetical protein VM553_16390 [Dongiaceae bacterium]|nr:hypothetical protein [Dongiaceae bacterium]
MVIQSAWLLHHKASLAPDSPMNLDGSTYMLGVGVVPAASLREAMDLFDAYLVKQKMELLDLWKCEKWSPENFADSTLESKQINAAASKALEAGNIHYTCGISSEALDCEAD